METSFHLNPVNTREFSFPAYQQMRSRLYTVQVVMQMLLLVYHLPQIIFKVWLTMKVTSGLVDLLITHW